MIILGIDPGLSGAFVWLQPANANGPLTILACEDMPTYETKVGTGVRRRIDLDGVWNLLHRNMANVVVMETLGVRPGSGSPSVSQTGRGYGQIEGLLRGVGLRPLYVTPKDWKKGMRLATAATKDDSRELAKRHFQTSVNLFARKKDDGRAEAALIALYGSRLP